MKKYLQFTVPAIDCMLSDPSPEGVRLLTISEVALEEAWREREYGRQADFDAVIATAKQMGLVVDTPKDEDWLSHDGE